MSLYGLNNKLPKIQTQPLVPKKVQAETLSPSGTTETSGVSGVSGSSGSNTMPNELKELLTKYQEEGCTKEEILNVLNKLGIKANENGNKINFEYNGTQYSLTYTESTPAESRVASAPDVTSDDNATFVQEFDEFINGVNAEIDSIETELESLVEIAITNNLQVDFSEYENKLMQLSTKMFTKRADIEIKNPNKYTDEMKTRFEECSKKLSSIDTQKYKDDLQEHANSLLDKQREIDAKYNFYSLFAEVAYDQENHDKEIEELFKPQGVSIPDILNMSIGEIDEALSKYESMLNAVKGQIELLDKKGANQGQHSRCKHEPLFMHLWKNAWHSDVWKSPENTD